MGLVAIAASVMLPGGLLVKIGVLLLGVLLFGGALLTLGRAMPSSRRYVAFRTEVEYFLDLARGLNWAAAAVAPDTAAEDVPRIREIRQAMVESVDRMVRYAGRTPRQVDAIDVFIEHELGVGRFSPSEAAVPQSQARAQGKRGRSPVSSEATG